MAMRGLLKNCRDRNGKKRLRKLEVKLIIMRKRDNSNPRKLPPDKVCLIL